MYTIKEAIAEVSSCNWELAILALFFPHKNCKHSIDVDTSGM